ncbi:MAG: MerR family transcriptional regulator [Proteobacteria bacterium]|nr:MerR family transcriptional regulator [Pseudomonadota bacterium]
MGAQPIPQRLYYRIGEVADIAGVKPHVLRYWETEFGFLSPAKNEGNQRLYTQKDLQKVLTIKKLLYEDRYTIAGAKRRFREEWKSAQEAGAAGERAASLRQVRREIEEILRFLERE